MNKIQIKKLAKKLLKKNKLNDWKFKFNNSIYTIGLCNRRNKTIYLSNKYYKEMDDFSKDYRGAKIYSIKQLLLHEIAHAKTRFKTLGDVSNTLFGHNNKFWNQFYEIGGQREKIVKNICKVGDYFELVWRLPILILMLPFAIIYGTWVYYKNQD